MSIEQKSHKAWLATGEKDQVFARDMNTCTSNAQVCISLWHFTLVLRLCYPGNFFKLSVVWYVHTDICATALVWESEDNFACQSLPSTLFELGFLLHCSI